MTYNEALQAHVAVMRELGMIHYEGLLPNVNACVTITLAPVSTTFAPGVKREEAPVSVPLRRCACGHSLGRHTTNGECLDREPSGRPCTGRCRLITATPE